MDAHQGDHGCQTQEIHYSEGEAIPNPGKLNIEIFELDANNSFTMHLGKPILIYDNNLLRW